MNGTVAVQRAPTIGILSLILGGEYYGGVVSGIQRTIAQQGGRVVGIRTLQLWQDPVLGFEPSRYVPYALDYIDGIILLFDSVRQEDLIRIQETGKPLVSISTHYPDLGIPSVQPDNRSCMIELVQHLIAHGHTRIAFVGCMTVHDVRERHAAYEAALREAGIEPDPALLFAAPNNLQSGGLVAADALLAAGVPCTAIFTATDDNALALMTRFQEAGYRIPTDVAIASYDDSPQIALSTPALTSIQMKPDDVGAAAARALLARLGGADLPARLLVPGKVIYRQSCGCWVGGTVAPVSLSHLHAAPDPGRSLIQAMLADMGEFQVAAGVQETAVLAASIEQVVATYVAVLQGSPVPAPGALALAWRDIVAHATCIEDVSRAVGTLRRFVQDALAAPPGATPQVRANIDLLLNELRVEVLYAARYPFVALGHDSEATKHQSYNASKTLLEQNDESPRDLSWLSVTSARAACLGLWRDDAPGTELILSSIYPHDIHPGRALAASYRPEVFPPLDIFEAAMRDDGLRTIVVIPLQTATRDWGALAMMAPIETQGTAAADTVWQWSVLLIAALERERLLATLRQSERKLEFLAHHDALTGLPNRALFYDRVAQFLAFGQRSQAAFALLLLDLDDFKGVNDTLGHAAGDRLLQIVAQRTRDALRGSDTVARLGGDEFAILLHDADAVGARDAVDRIRAALHGPVQLEQGVVRTHPSIGIAVFPTDGETYDTLFEHADRMMYREKHACRNGHVP